jgi:hypothetical protein
VTERISPTRWRKTQGEPLELGSTHGCYTVVREASSLGSGRRYWVRCPHGRELVKRAYDLRKAPTQCRVCPQCRACPQEAK